MPAIVEPAANEGAVAVAVADVEGVPDPPESLSSSPHATAKAAVRMSRVANSVFRAVICLTRPPNVSG
jgi:hypothetical protein